MSRARRMDLAIGVLGVVLIAEIAGLSSLAADACPRRLLADGAQAGPSADPATRPAPILDSAAESDPSPETDGVPDSADEERIPLEEPDRPDPPREPACAIEVVGPDGKPREYCSIVATIGGVFAWSGVTNDEGLMRQAPPGPEPVDLVIDACTCLHRVSGVLLEDHGHVRVTLPEGLSIAGRITFDGGQEIAREVLRIDLLRTGPLPASKDLPTRVRWSIEGGWRQEIHAPVRSDGTFRISGLDPGFAGHLALRPVERVTLVHEARPAEYLLTVPVAAGAQDLILHARRFPVLSGSARKEGAWIQMLATLPDSTTVSRSRGCSRDLRFEIPLDFRTPSKIALTISDQEFERTVALPGPFDRDVDVGTLEAPSVDGTRIIPPDDREERAATERNRALWQKDWDDEHQVEKTVHATVVDEAGAPVAGARVHVGRLIWCATGADGGFEIGPRLPPKFDIEISARAHAPLVVRDMDPAAADGRTFTIKRGHPVRLTVVDDLGAPFERTRYNDRCNHGWEVWATAVGSNLRLFPDDGIEWGIPRSIGGHPWSPAGPGSYDFLELPDGLVTFHVEGVEGPVWTLVQDSSVPEARVVVPAHGSIRLELDLRLDDRPIRVHVEPLTAGGTALDFRGDGALTYDGALLLRAVLPGDYVVRAEVPASAHEKTWRPFGRDVRVIVRAAETTVVPLGR